MNAPHLQKPQIGKNLKTLFSLIFFKDFFLWTIFLKSFLNVLQYCFGFMFWNFSHEACRILALWPGIEPPSPALGGEVLTAEPPGKSQKILKSRISLKTIILLSKGMLLLVAQLCPTVCNPMDCIPPGSSVYGILARILEWVVISFSRGSSWPRDRT